MKTTHHRHQHGRWTAILVLLLVVAPLCATPSGAFLSSLLGSTETSEPPPPAAAGDSSATLVARPRPDARPSRVSLDLASLSQLHAHLRLQVSAGRAIPTRCRGVATEATLVQRCERLTPTDKTYLAVAFTECHFDSYTHKYRDARDDSSCQRLASHPAAMAECVKDMNAEDRVLQIFTQFQQAMEHLCTEVDHDFQRRRAHEAMDSILGATLETARALGQLQEGTEQLEREIGQRMEASGSAVLDLLASHTSAESLRFEALSSSAAKLEKGQAGLMDQLATQTTQLRDLLADAQGIQRLINATSQDIESTQQDILTLQASTHATLGDTRDELLQMKTAQKESFTAALASLTTLQSLSEALSEAQASNTELVANLAVDQEAAFRAAAKELGQLQAEQRQAFRANEEQMKAVQATQAELHSSQSSLLSSMKLSGEALADLARTQAESFLHTGTSLDRIQQQAAEVEGRLGAMLGELKHLASQLLNLNVDLLAELFQIHSALFYVALVPLAYLATATERTKAARFWIFLLLLTALLLELNLVSAAHRFRLQLSQAEFDGLRARLRYALSVLSCGVVLLTALLHRDLASLSHALHERNARVLGNNHRMLHELIRRTEHFSPSNSPPASNQREGEEPPARKSYEPRNPFKQPPASSPRASTENPLGEGRPQPQQPRDMPDLERCSWQHAPIDGPDACCADQRSTGGVGRFFSFTRARSTTPSVGDREVKHEFDSTRTTSTDGLRSPRVTSNSRASPRGAKLRSTNEEDEREGHEEGGEAASPLETNDDEEESVPAGTPAAPRPRTPRATRSRSRAPDLPPPAVAASASHPSSHHHRAQSAKHPLLPPSAVKEEPTSDERVDEEEEPGETASMKKKRKARKTI